MVNYNEGKIYKIVCNVTGEVYIGSTCMPTLAKRLAEHRNGFKRWKEGKNKKHTRSFQIIERGDYSIVLIENVNCDTKEELLRRERFHIEINTCINKQIPLRTNAEYYLDNKEHIKEYRLKNKEHIKEYDKEYNLKNKEHIKEQKSKKFVCECGGCYIHSDRARHFKTIKHTNYILNLI